MLESEFFFGEGEEDEIDGSNAIVSFFNHRLNMSLSQHFCVANESILTSFLLFSLLLLFLSQAEIEGPEDTPYHTRYFQLKLVLSTDFPSKPPRGYFLTKIYHPNVDPTTGAICVNTLKKDWTSTTSLSHVLTVIRCLLIVPFPESSLNDEAGKNFMESYDEYAKRARLLAGVHGLTRWSCVPMGGGGGNGGAASGGGSGEGKTPEDSDNEDSMMMSKGKQQQQHHLHLDGKKSPTTLPNNAVDNSSGSSSSPGKKLKKSSHHCNIVRGNSSSNGGGKSLDKKKSKKKSLKRL